MDGHRWSLDDLVTAWFAVESMGATTPGRHVDLGCGIGSVLLMVAWSFPDLHSVGIEAQAVSVDLARRSIAYDGVEDRVRVIHGDLRETDAPTLGTFDLVTGTPPYFDIADGTVSEAVQRGPCRFEMRGGIEAYMAAANRLLADGGRFVTCETAGAVERVQAAAAATGLSLRRWRDVVPRAGKAPLFSVFECARAPGASVHEAPIIVRDTNGCRTAQFVAIREHMGMPP
jgi:tRNA1(Val) A37 N6-methylase TrmN6